MIEYTILLPDGHLYRGTNGGPDVWRETSERVARQVLAVLNATEGRGHTLISGYRRRNDDN